MENDQIPKRVSQNPSRSRISLKDIPPLVPSSIPYTNLSRRPRKMMFPVNVNEVEQDNVNEIDSNRSKDESKKGSMKSVLNEICASKEWKYPSYVCCNAEGPRHMRFFTYKVVVEVREFSKTILLECFGDPKRTKKAAAEHAAEAAVWYLKHSQK